MKVDFLRAINSKRNIKYETWENFYPLNKVLNIMSINSSDARGMINGNWYIED